MRTCEFPGCGEPSVAVAVRTYVLPEGSSEYVPLPNASRRLCQPHAQEYFRETANGHFPDWWGDVLNMGHEG
jgi:hypothetical protein